MMIGDIVQLAIADAVFAVPSHCPQDDLSLEMPPFKISSLPNIS
jgi:hypothetical protein